MPGQFSPGVEDARPIITAWRDETYAQELPLSFLRAILFFCSQSRGQDGYKRTSAGTITVPDRHLRL